MDHKPKNDAFHGAEADEFWDISKLIPKKEKKPSIPYTSYVRSHVRTSDAVFAPASSVRQETFDDALRLTDVSVSGSQGASRELSEPKQEEQYVPDFNKLIKNV